MGQTVYVRKCRVHATGKIIELPVAAFLAGNIQSFVGEISEPYPLADTETAMVKGGQRNAMRERAHARE